MGSGGKGGSANQSLNYYGTVAGAICWGPLDWLQAIVLNGNYLFQGNLTLTEDVTDLTGTLADPAAIGPGGYLRLYRGTETQPADPALTGHPPGRGTVLLVGKNLFFGEDSGTAPNLQIIGGRLPRVSTAIVAGSDNIVDDGQVNPVAALAEILLDERGAGLDESQLDAASWLAASHWAAQDQAHRDYAYCSPLITEQAALRDIVTQLLDPLSGFLRRTSAGKLACCIYEWGVDPGGLPLLDANQWLTKPKIPLGDWTQVPTELLVNFTDRAYEYQNNSVLLPNVRAAEIRQVDDQQSIDRKHVTRAAQAAQQATEYLRRISLAPSVATITVRQPFVSGLLIGDKIKLDTNPEPGGASIAQLARIDKIEQDRTDAATLTVTIDKILPASAYSPSPVGPTPGTSSAPPLQYMLGMILPPAAWGWPMAIGLLATRPAASLSGFEAYFGATQDGDFSDLGSQPGFAVRASLQAGIDGAATTLAFTELDGLSAPDATLAANTPGGNATAAANDTLLALIAQLDSNGRIAIGGDGNPVMELVSIVDRATDNGLPAATFNYTVLRGRLGTTAQAWPAAAPVWIVPRCNITPWHQQLLASMGGEVAWFRLVSFTPRAIDDSTPVPGCGVNIPGSGGSMMQAPGPNTAPGASPLVPGTYGDLFGIIPSPLTGGLQWNPLSGTANLIGYPQLTTHALLGDSLVDPATPISPPPLYLQKTWRGTLNANIFNTNTPHCDISNIVSGDCGTTTFSGSCSYDPDTGSLTNTAAASETGANGGISAASFPGAGGTLPGYHTHGAVYDYSLTHERISGNNTCQAYDEYRYGLKTGSLQCDLSGPDNEANAIVRFRLSHSDAGYSSTPVQASIQQRTTATSFDFSEFKLKGAWAGAEPFWAYSIQVQLQVSSDSGVTWSDAELVEQVNFADEDGNLAFAETTIVADVGQQKRVKTVSLISGG